MELRVSNKQLITAPIRDMLVQGESGADVFEIVLPRLYGALDLSGFSFKLRGAGEPNTLTEQLLTARPDGDALRLEWPVTADFTALEGTLSLELTAVSPDGSQVLKFPGGDIRVRPALTGEYAPPADLLQQSLTQMQALAAQAVAQASAQADRAASYAGKSAYDLWLESGNSGTAEDFLLSLRGEDGTGLLILGTLPDAQALALAYPDGSGLAGGFLIGGAYYYWDTLLGSWQNAGELRGAKGEKGDRGEKGDSARMTVVTNLLLTAASVTVQDNTEYRYAELSSLTVSFPQGDFCAAISFTSGSTATAVYFPEGTKCMGCDVENGVFSPVSNRRYQLGLYFDGLYATVVAGGC